MGVVAGGYAYDPEGGDIPALLPWNGGKKAVKIPEGKAGIKALTEISKRESKNLGDSIQGFRVTTELNGDDWGHGP